MASLSERCVPEKQMKLNMDKYESEQYNAIQDWKKSEPSVLAKAFGVVAKPVSWLVKIVIPRGVIESILTGTNFVAKWITDSDDIKRDGGVDQIADLRNRETCSLNVCDQLADNVHNWAVGAATVEGGAAGYFGLPGMILDTPALITMGLRVIYKIGLCYGYEFNNDVDRQFALGILSVASANTMSEKNTSLLMLKQISVMISKVAWKNMTEKGGVGIAIIQIKELAKRIGINITKRKAAQAVPVIGAGVGAAMNAKYLNDIAWAARRSFQERWLRDNGLIVEVSEENLP